MSLFWFRPTPDHPWFTTVALILLSGVSTTQAADQAKAKKSDKKPGNATVDKTTAKEKKQLSKVLEQQGKSEESTREALNTITPADRRQALQTVQAIQSFVKAVEAAEKASDSGTESIEKLLADRPKKAVEKPTLLPADIDKLMEVSLAKSGIQAASIAADGTFLRRVSLDMVGLIPTPEQTAQFEQSKDPEKRLKVIQKLVDSPAFAANWSKYWRDVIRFRATETQAKRFQPLVLENYLREKFAKNTPWDEIAREMITATGSNEENPAVLLTMAQESKAEETAGEVSRVFMGVQIQCAQCHDHPTDSWKRQQFQEFAAYFSGVRSVNFSGNQIAAGQRVFGVRAAGQAAHKVANPKDPSDMQQFSPKFFLGDKSIDLPVNAPVDARRAVAASYIASQDNPWFAKAFVNRVWYALMGDTFYMPVDDLGPDRKGKNLEVLDAIAAAWSKSGYDIKWLYQTIAATQTYQRDSRAGDPSASEESAAGANCPTRLRADQILQNLRQVTGKPILGVKPPENARRARADMAKSKAAGVPAPLQGPAGRAILKAYQTFAFDPSTPDDDVVGTIPQALFLMNAPDLNKAVEATDGSILKKILDESSNNDSAALKALYERTLARLPNSDEQKVAADYIKEVGNRNQAFEDLFWSLLNSAEFLSRR